MVSTVQVVSEAAAAAASRSLPKAILLGDFGSGKSALFHRLTRGAFNGGTAAAADTTAAAGDTRQIGVGCVAIRLPDRTKILLQDTCGMERFGASLTRGYYRGAVCAILVADAANLHTVRGLDYWNTEAQCYAPDASKILVFSKSDSPVADSGLIGGGEIESYQARLGCCRGAIVSSKTGRGMEQLLQIIAEACQLYRSRENESLSKILMMEPKFIRLKEESEQSKSPDFLVELPACCALG